jgi:hypothetical protein
MKYFLGVVLALAIGLLVFRLAKNPDNEAGTTSKSAIVATQPGEPGVHNTTIKEVIQATSYTYMRVKEGMAEYWVATIKDDAKVGDPFTFSEALEMKDFKSKDLDRTFETIYFISDQPAEMNAAAGMPTTMGKPKVENATETVIPQSEGGISIGELFKNRDKYSGKKIRVKGKVAKVNEEVMDKNWVHLQDGTRDGESFDLTVTTLEKATVGDIVEFEGTIVLNKDFGAGYVYDVIMEEGKIRK